MEERCTDVLHSRPMASQAALQLSPRPPNTGRTSVSWEGLGPRLPPAPSPGACSVLESPVQKQKRSMPGNARGHSKRGEASAAPKIQVLPPSRAGMLLPSTVLQDTPRAEATCCSAASLVGIAAAKASGWQLCCTAAQAESQLSPDLPRTGVAVVEVAAGLVSEVAGGVLGELAGVANGVADGVSSEMEGGVSTGVGVFSEQ
mmetsp:Transcript_34805/g.98676  ORF Transcript_34805/g.98676 Transcript_34805/m.98676 type:complete len:202 (+) Transcript_34805:802-1407(+)